MSNGKKLTKRRIKKKNNDCFWMENIFCLESHIHLCSRHTSAIPAYVIKTCVTWHAISGTRYWGFVSPKLHVSTYRNQQHCWWFHYLCASFFFLKFQLPPRLMSCHCVKPTKSRCYKLFNTSVPGKCSKYFKSQKCKFLIQVTDWILEHFLWNCCQVHAT